MTFSQLYEAVRAELGEKRFSHTIGVINAARLLGEKCLPEKVEELACAALLHDVTKELSDEEQATLLKDEWCTLSPDEKESPQIFHSYTAPYVIRARFPEYATEEILSAVRKHTVGDEEMTVFDMIIFIADYIEDGRTYSECVEVREYLYSALGDDLPSNVLSLMRACVMAIDNTVASLNKRGKMVAKKTELVKAALLNKIKQQ